MPVIYRYQEALRRRLRQIEKLKRERERWQVRIQLDPALSKFCTEHVKQISAKIAALESKRDS